MGRIADFIDQYSNRNTRKGYTGAVRRFLASVYGEPTDPADWEHLADRYFSEDRDYQGDLLRFAGNQGDSAPKTVRARITAIKEFFIFSDIEIREKQIRAIRKRIPKGGAITVEKDLDVTTLQSIVHHSPVILRAMVLLMASSGMRIGEVLQLKIADIDLSKGIGHITIRVLQRGEGVKGGQQRYTFCSTEAVGMVAEWLKVRDRYLESSMNKAHGLNQSKIRNDERVFPVSKSTIAAMWCNALEKAGHSSRDPVTHRLQITPHSLRKFFSSQLALAAPRDIVELLMGHSGYLSDAYRRYPKKQVEEIYRKAEAYVTVHMTDEIRELRTTTDKKMQAHSEIIETLVQRSLAGERRIKELEDLTRTLSDYIRTEQE